MITEGEVADALAMSRTPVREAFLRLQAEKLLRLFPKRGAVVDSISPAEAAGVLEARVLLESWAAEQVLALDDSTRTKLCRALRKQLAEQRTAVKERDPVTFQLADREFHLTLVAAAGNAVILDLYRTLRDSQLRIGVASIVSDPKRAREVLAEHADIAAAVAAASTDRLLSLIRAHVDATRRSIGIGG